MSPEYRVALLGHGIGPSLSPALHEREAQHLGLSYEYVTVDLIDVPDVDLGEQLGRLEDEGFAAVNVTHPFKQQVLGHVDELGEVVERIGSANLVLLGRGRRTAHNTDCTGFRHGLESFLGDRPRGRVLQVGAGGAGLATAYSLIGMGFEELVVHDRSTDAADRLVDRFAGATGASLAATDGSLEPWQEKVDGVVHVTPMGMAQHPGVALEPERLRPDAWVAEVVYRPLETELLRRARAHGLDTLDGGAMAVGQAVDSLRLITGREPDVERMNDHFRQLVS
ncbi:shikimate dehydrogenase [Nocardioides panaciterrulae]|uniref:Shikimate dehydrogenase n=1 Tax=Nocardioides panaciterrulae TaxID=661492 RepID=A0A7Y9E3A6_9ACTN|nr:shikimate dehydrogenase [Nocardioides panaciterrulae]NYD40319.1 shikimate dehydrogenase [Nocardioides panaciterrulae]